MFKISITLNEMFAGLTARELTIKIAGDDGASYALKETVAKGATRDPVDALRDAEVALGVAWKRCAELGLIS